jgi:hypothetical protein
MTTKCERPLSEPVALLSRSVEADGLEPHEARRLRTLHESLHVRIPLRSLMFLMSAIEACLRADAMHAEQC